MQHLHLGAHLSVEDDTHAADDKRWLIGTAREVNGICLHLRDVAGHLIKLPDVCYWHLAPLSETKGGYRNAEMGSVCRRT